VKAKGYKRMGRILLVVAKGGKDLPLGTVRTWRGKEMVKIAPGKWIPKKNGGNEEHRNALEDMSILSGILKTDQSVVIKNKELGDISVDAGEAKRKSFGIKHIIHERYKNENKTPDEIASLLMLLVDTLRDGSISRDVSVQDKNGQDIGRYDIEKKGIVAIVSKQRHGKDEKFVITGFDDINKKEASEAIQTGIAQYGYTPEFSYFRKQVGAVLASLNPVSTNSGEKASGEVKKA
jgi:hypothetical protein